MNCGVWFGAMIMVGFIAAVALWPAIYIAGRRNGRDVERLRGRLRGRRADRWSPDPSDEAGA